jgi:DnaD/phage-associated family protein
MDFELVDYQCIDFKQLLLLRGKKIGLSDEEAHVLMLMMMMDELNIRPITPKRISQYSSLENSQIDAIMLKLINEHYVDRINGVLEFSPVKKKLLGVKDVEKEEVNLVAAFEDGFGRSLSATEIEMINEFKRDGYDDEMILDALKEAVKSHVTNFRYVEKVLINWKNSAKSERLEAMKHEEDHFSDEVKNFKLW